MKYLLIPNTTTSREAILWIGAFENPGNKKIEILSRIHPSPLAGKWQRWPAEKAPAKIYYQRLNLYFEQYQDLVRILMGSKKSLVILTGDVHFGRIAWTTLPSGAKLVEIISSPLELIHKTASGNWRPAPSRFPAENIKGLPSCNVFTFDKFSATYGHFLTIEFSGKAGGVNIAVKVWSTAQIL